MDAISIVFLLIVSGVYAVYPDVCKNNELYSIVMCIISFFIEDKSTNIAVNDTNTTTTDQVPYEKKYVIKFRSMDNQLKTDVSTMKCKMVFDYTPYGNVCMKYDDVRNIFIYYSDHSMPYRFLESVAQKFAIQFHCKDLVVDTEEEIEKIKDKNNLPLIDKIENNNKTDNVSNDKLSNPEKSKPDKPSVFTKFKSYNKTTAPGSSSVNRDISLENKHTETDHLLLEKSNTYSYEGKFSNMEILQKVDSKRFDDRLKMSYADFKRMGMNK